MPRDPRPYITVHDGMPEHPKVEALSDGAFRLLIDLWCYCHRNHTNGRVPATTWRKRGTPRTRAELLAAPFAVNRPDGDVEMREYLDHQQSTDDIAAARERKATAGRAGGLAKAAALAKQRASNVLAPATASASPPALARSKQKPGTDVAALALAVEVLPSEAPITSGGGAVAPVAESEGKQANRLAKTYVDLVPLSNFPAIAGVVRKAVRAGMYADEQITDALQRMAKDGRPVTADALRIELDGWTPRTSRREQQAALVLDPHDEWKRNA